MSQSPSWHEPVQGSGPGRGRSALRRAVGVLCGAVLIVPAGLAGAEASTADRGGDREDGSAKIRPAVTAELRTQEEATVLVRFADQPDLSVYEGITSWEERGEAVYDALASTAEQSQAAARALLDEAGVDHQSFFVSNAIVVPSVDRELVLSLAAEPEVEGIYQPTTYDVPEPVVRGSEFAPAAVGWNVADVNADDVWSQFGITGSGIVVGSIDTGVDHRHPALVRQYRGSNGDGDGSFTHDYNWFDASGGGATAPVDADGHGTHTTGSMVGDDGGANQIGVAPGARWIAANGCCPSNAALLASAQWMLAPTDLAGLRPRPALRPHVVNNSWGSTAPSNDPFLEDVSRAWAAAGIFAVWANGNNGPGCASSGTPGSRVINYSVGAYGANHQIGTTSSRGAGQDGEIKPNLAAPGVDVRSAWTGGRYVLSTGTSMAAPHVAGSVALLWSAVPQLRGDIPATKRLLDGSAVDSPGAQCGGTAADNNVFGEGRLDALALLTRGGAGEPVVRRAGGDRYATAAEVARHFDHGVDTVVLASGGGFPDALAGAARAGSLGGPVLLVRPASVPPGTEAELARLRPANIVIAGGTGVVSADVERAVREIVPSARVTRRAGGDRYGTAALIAADVPSADVVMVASGQSFPDALAGAARAGTLGAPLLLVRQDGLPDATRAELARLQPQRIVLLGGTGAVSEEVEIALGDIAPVTRVAGADRYGTAAAVAAELSSAERVLVATGLDWPDALAGAALAGATSSPMLLVRPDGVPEATVTELQRLAPGRVVVLGGTGVVAESVLTALRALR